MRSGVDWLGARWLQCGHGPKAVENQCRGQTSIWQVWQLQCGHGPKAVENGHRSAG